MADWYVNDQNLSPGAGTTPGNAANKLSDVLGSVSPGDIVWVAAESDGTVAEVNTTYSICGASGFKTNPLRISGWPQSSAQPLYSIRPAAGISAGWDAHVPSVPDLGGLATIRFSSYFKSGSGVSIPNTLPSLQREVVPFFTYHGVYIYNLYVYNHSSGGMFALNTASLHQGNTGKIFIAENCEFRSPVGIGPGYFTTRGDLFVWGDGNPQVHYIDCYINLNGGYLYNSGPPEQYLYGTEYDQAYTQLDGYNTGHQQIWAENSKFNNGGPSLQSGFSMLSEESTTVVPRWTLLSPWFRDVDTPSDSSWLLDLALNQGSFEQMMTYANTQYGYENPACNFHPVTRPSQSTASGYVAAGYRNTFPQTTVTRPGSSSPSFIAIACDCQYNHGNGVFPDGAAPKQVGRKGATQLPYAPFHFHQACFPRRTAEAYTFQGIAGQPLTVSFWMAVRNMDFSDNGETGAYPISPIFREAGAQAVILKCINQDGTIKTSVGSWDGAKPTANEMWGKLTATITPDIDSPVWCYIHFVSITNIRYGGNTTQFASFNNTNVTYLIDPIPEVT